MIPTHYNRLGAGINQRNTWVIEHGAGVLDISISGATNLLWQFPDGSTSTVARPAKTVTKGTTIVTCDDFSANGVDVYIYGASTALASYPIQVKSLPALTYQLSADANGITGKVADLPRVTNNLRLYNLPNVAGTTADLPRVTSYLYLNSLSGLTGTTADLPRVTTTLHLHTLSGLTGTVADLPRAPNYLTLAFLSGLTGTVVDAPEATAEKRIFTCINIIGAMPIKATNTPIYFYGNDSVTPAEYDQTIANCVAAGGTGRTLYISNRRTSASDADVATLLSRGWTVNDTNI